MFSTITNQCHSFSAPAKTKTTLLSLPPEILEEIGELLDPDTRDSYGEALTDLTENQRAKSSPAWGLHLLSHLLQKIPLKQPLQKQLQQQILLARIPKLKKFVFDQFRTLFEQKSDQFHQIVKIPALFNLLSLVKDSALLNFLAERIQQSPALQQELLRWVERSKTDGQVQTQAANALTLLVKAGVPLNGMDFRGIRVSGADLSGGIFDNTQFQGADLSRVNLQGAWLRKTNFEGANLANANFGAIPLSKINIALSQIDASILPLILKEPIDEIRACSKDGKWLISGSDQAVKLWSVAVNPPVLHQEFNSNQRLALAFSPDSNWLALNGNNQTIELWSLEASIPIHSHTLQVNRLRASHIVFSPNSDRLALSCAYNGIELWSLQGSAPKLERIFKEYIELGDMPFSPNGKWLALGGKNGSIELWSLETEQPALQHTLREQGALLNMVSFSPDGKWLISASGSFNFTVNVWLIENAPFMLWQTWHINFAMYCKLVTPSNSQWITPLFGNSNNRSSYFDKDKAWVAEIDPRMSSRVPAGHTSSVKSMALSQNGKWLAVHSEDRTITLWSIKKDVPVLQDTLRLSPPSVTSTRTSIIEFSNVAFSKDGHWLALAEDKTVNLWNLKVKSSESPPFQLTEHTGLVTSLAFSPDSKWLVSGSRDKSAKLWSLKASAPEFKGTLAKNSHYFGDIYSTAFSEDNQWLALGDGNHGLELISLRAGSSTLKRHPFQIGGFSQESDPVSFDSMTFSPDSKRLAVGCGDSINLWSIKANLTKYEYPEGYLNASPDGASSLAFSPDGRWLASGGWGKFEIWSVDSQKCLAKIEGLARHPVSVGWIKTDKGETLLITSGPDQSIRCWRIKEIDSDHCDIYLYWSSHQLMLNADSAFIEGAQNLSLENTQLLTQYGAQEASTLMSNILDIS